ncbi:MAG: peptidylprolyl isomerase [Candidatus Omnitrophica bacterium]|nr:peptidylprolyl isomerase [Candidatus Omnitrophota bacterium]
MLNAFRTKHAKKVLWVLAGVIILVFVFFGAPSIFNDPSHQVIGMISGSKIRRSDFDRYFTMSRLFFYPQMISDSKIKITNEQIATKAWEFLVLDKKADLEQIAVTTEDLVQAIQKTPYFLRDGKFDKEYYYGFLKHGLPQLGLYLQPADFEKYIQTMLKIEKLEDKFITSKINITDSDLLSVYKKANQKAIITYIVTPFEKVKPTISVSQQAITDNYANNKEKFRVPSQVKFNYVTIDDSHPDRDKILRATTKTALLENISEKFSLEIKETGFLTEKDPIPGLGWEQLVTETAFSLTPNVMSPPIQIRGKVVLIEKKEVKESYIPELQEIFDLVKSDLKDQLALEKIKETAQKLLTTINENKVKSLKEVAIDQSLSQLKVTEQFGYNDYIEGLGLDKTVSDLIFSLSKGEIHNEYLLLLKGAYIIQLTDLTEVDNDLFEKEKPSYFINAYKRDYILKKLSFLTALESELDLKILLIQ